MDYELNQVKFNRSVVDNAIKKISKHGREYGLSKTQAEKIAYEAINEFLSDLSSTKNFLETNQ